MQVVTYETEGMWKKEETYREQAEVALGTDMLLILGGLLVLACRQTCRPCGMGSETKNMNMPYSLDVVCNLFATCPCLRTSGNSAGDALVWSTDSELNDLLGDEFAIADISSSDMYVSLSITSLLKP